MLFHKAFDTSDSHEVNIGNIKHLLSKSDFVCIVALVGEKIIGGLTGYELAGIKEIFVQADKADQHAVNFYSKLGGEALEALQFTL